MKELVEIKCRQQEITAKLIQMFDWLLDESQSMWLSDYCCSDEDRKKRIIEDEQYRDEFLLLLEDLVKLAT